MSNTRILLVEDDRNFGTVLRDYLALHDFAITLKEDGVAGLEAFTEEEFDLCILDVMLPKKDGFTLAAEIKAHSPSVPFIFLTAKALKEDVVKGFRTGADDYITKPFDSEVLLFKIRAILNRQNHRTAAPVTKSFSIGKLYFDHEMRMLTGPGAEYRLSPKESALLHMLCRYRNDILPRNKALLEIWKEENYFTARSMDVYIARLRKYLQDDPEVTINNLHGSGYILITPAIS